MRIITGSAKGVKLLSLPGEETRPTPERVKEAVFSAIQFDIAGRRVLDLFGGSGQLALEALSRGAEGAVIVDSAKKAAELIRANSARAKLPCRVICADWREYIKKASGKERFGLVFLDPPYKDGFLDEVIKRVKAAGLFGEDCIVVCESAKSGVPAPPDGFSCRLYEHGKVCTTILKSEADSI